MSHLEGAYEQVNQRLAGIELRFDGVDRRFDAVDRRFDAVERRFDAVDRKFDALRTVLEDRIDQRFMWTIGALLSTWLATMLAVLFHH